MAAQDTDLRIAVQENASWSRRLSITVPRERVSRVRQSVASQIARNVRLPGFRKGHMPSALVEKQFGQAIDQETMDRVIQESYREALETQNLRPITQGQIEKVEYAKETDLTYEVEFEVQPQLELSRVSGFVVARPSSEVGQDEVDAVLERLRHDRSTVRVEEEGRPDYNDEVTVEITDLDAEPAEGEEGPESRTFRFTLGEKQAIPDIEQAIMTLSPGEEAEFQVRFPEDFPDPEQAGKEQRLRIQLTELRRRDFPALDDELAKSVGDFETLDALKERVRADLDKEAQRRSDEEVKAGLIREVSEANPFDLPESMVERYTYFLVGIDPDKGPEQIAKLGPQQAEQFSQMRTMMRPQAESALRRMMIVEHLAEREGLRATADEVDARVEKLAEEHGISPSDAWIQLEKSGQIQALESEITEEKVFDYLRSQNTVA